LETAQALDEAQEVTRSNDGSPDAKPSGVKALSTVEGVEFALASRDGKPERFDAIGLENAERLNTWARQTEERFRALGEQIHAGPLEQIEGLGLQRHVTLATVKDSILCIGWSAMLAHEDIRERMKKVVALWAS
jgi:hypothetical protein